MCVQTNFIMKWEQSTRLAALLPWHILALLDRLLHGLVLARLLGDPLARGLSWGRVAVAPSCFSLSVSRLRIPLVVAVTPRWTNLKAKRARVNYQNRFSLPFRMSWNTISHSLSRKPLNIVVHSLLSTVPRSLLSTVARSLLSTSLRSWSCSSSHTQSGILVFRSRLQELPALLQLGRPKPQAERRNHIEFHIEYSWCFICHDGGHHRVNNLNSHA